MPGKERGRQIQIKPLELTEADIAAINQELSRLKEKGRGGRESVQEATRFYLLRARAEKGFYGRCLELGLRHGHAEVRAEALSQFDADGWYVELQGGDKKMLLPKLVGALDSVYEMVGNESSGRVRSRAAWAMFDLSRVVLAQEGSLAAKLLTAIGKVINKETDGEVKEVMLYGLMRFAVDPQVCSVVEGATLARWWRGRVNGFVANPDYAYESVGLIRDVISHRGDVFAGVVGKKPFTLEAMGGVVSAYADRFGEKKARRLAAWTREVIFELGVYGEVETREMVVKELTKRMFAGN